MPTGIDRVELAYLLKLLQQPEPLFGIARTGLGYVLLDRAGAMRLRNRFIGEEPWGEPDFLSRLYFRRPMGTRIAESDMRRLCLDRCRPRGLGQMLRRHLPRGTVWMNTGHSNLTARMFAAISGLGGRTTVMIHDTIPLDYPEFQRRGSSEGFAAMLVQIATRADLVICNSDHTRDRLSHHLAHLPEVVVAPLGVEMAEPDKTSRPPDLDLTRPYFVTLGTIEPRKDHALLLDVWEELARDRRPSEMPGLLICGSRGWENAEVFDRLDVLPIDGPVRELPGLPDAAVASLLAGSHGLLFPSHAEGYGLPPIEAAALGVPVVVRDLPVYRETLGDIPVYLSESGRYPWKKAVETLLEDRERPSEAGSVEFHAPTWDAHFKEVLRLT